MTQIGQLFQIVAPASSAEDAKMALEAGANEIYCGAMLGAWSSIYGDGDFLTRRQGAAAHVTDADELARLVAAVHTYGDRISLTVNARYSRAQEDSVLDLIQHWRTIGGSAVLVSDLSILLALRDSSLQRHLSIMAGAFNSRAVQLFADMGVCRVVLPRSLTVEEVGELIAKGPAIEYEMLAMNQKCEFIDALCGFHHATRFPEGRRAAIQWQVENGRRVVLSTDLANEGHGCSVVYETKTGVVRHLDHNDECCPPCAACTLPELHRAGVRFLKIAGRGYPSALITRSIRFLRQSEHIISQCVGDEVGGALRELYRSTFGYACEGRHCYYPLPSARKDA